MGYSIGTLIKQVVICLALVDVPIALLGAILLLLRDSAGIGSVTAGGQEIDWYDFATRMLLGPLLAVFTGLALCFALWVGWNIVKQLNKLRGTSSLVLETSADVDNVKVRESSRDGDDLLDYFRTRSWFKDLFVGFLAFIGVFFPLVWLAFAVFSEGGLGAYLDVLAAISIIVAVPLMALVVTVATWLNVAIGAWVFRSVAPR